MQREFDFLQEIYARTHTEAAAKNSDLGFALFQHGARAKIHRDHLKSHDFVRTSVDLLQKSAFLLQIGRLRPVDPRKQLSSHTDTSR